MHGHTDTHTDTHTPHKEKKRNGERGREGHTHTHTHTHTYSPHTHTRTHTRAPCQRRPGASLLLCSPNVLRVALRLHLQTVRRAAAQGGVTAGHELGARPVGFPADQAVQVLAVVLVCEVDVGILVHV